MGILDFGDDEDQKQSSDDSLELADKLTALVEESGIEVEDLAIAEDDGVVSIGGIVGSSADKKKLIKLINAAEGVSEVEDALEVEGEEEEESEENEDGEIVHTVVAGDTLWGLAEHYYGDGSRYMEIFQANKQVWKKYNYDPNVIYQGWELIIP